MTEKQPQLNKEQISNSAELEQANIENQNRIIAEKIKENKDKLPNNTERHEQDALHEALEQAESKEREDATEEQAPQEEPITTALTKDNLDIRFNKTLERIQKDMTPTSRAFSKVIHNPLVDKTSEAIGRTVARPNLILAGGIGTLTLGLAVYLIAKQYGYVLSGFEAMGSFIAGWLIGAVVEFIRVGFKNKRDL